jgi:hypothetical protein
MKTYKPIYIERNNRNEKVAGLVFLLVITVVLLCAGVASAQNYTAAGAIRKANIQLQPGASNNSAIIQWNVATDCKYPFFLVERSTDKIHYEIVSVVKNTGNCNATTCFAATDYNPLHETTYYRVSTLDAKGKAQQHLAEITYTVPTQLTSK